MASIRTNRTNRDDAKLAAVREGVPAATRMAFLNAGSHGPLTTAAGAVITSMAEEELSQGRLGGRQFQVTAALKAATRAQFARVLHCDPDEVALTMSTTTGMNIACWGLHWQPGDEVITTTVEHMGGLYPLYLLERRYGIRIRFAETGAAGERLLESIEAALSERTRVVLVSHVSWSTGLVLPVREIAELAHRAGALLFVDGAQSAGAIPADVRSLGADAYAIPGQKWLCGPEGYGALYVARDRAKDILPSWAGGGAFGEHDLAGHYTLREDAGRFTIPDHPYTPALAGMKASLEWFLDDVGEQWAYERIAANAARCRQLLEGIEGVDVLTPPGRQAGLLHFKVAGWDPFAVDEELLRRGVLIRAVQDPACLRVSTGFWNSDDDLQALAQGLRELLASPPNPSMSAR